MFGGAGAKPPALGTLYLLWNPPMGAKARCSAAVLTDLDGRMPTAAVAAVAAVAAATVSGS